MTTLTLYVGSDNVIQLALLKNETTDAYINDATVTVTLYDDTGTEVAGESWPLAMAYVAASDGTYRATLADTLSAVADKDYTATVDANGGAGLHRYWEDVPVRTSKSTG